jgi:hypothetical protein
MSTGWSKDISGSQGVSEDLRTVADELPADLHAYAAATQKLREAAKWLLAAAAGVGGLLLAGLQLGSVGDLPLPRIVIALIALIMALAGVGMVIRCAGALLTQDWVTLAELASDDVRQRVNERWKSKRERRPFPDLSRLDNWARPDAASIYADLKLARYREELYGNFAQTPEELFRQFKQANEQARRRAAAGASPASDDAARYDRELRLAVQKVVEFANYRRTRANFTKLETVLFWSACAVVAGVTTFAIAAPSESGGQDSKTSPAVPTTATASPSPPVQTSLPVKPAHPTPTRNGVPP